MKAIKKTLAVVGAAAVLAVTFGATADAATSNRRIIGNFASFDDCQAARVIYAFSGEVGPCLPHAAGPAPQGSTWFFYVD